MINKSIARVRYFITFCLMITVFVSTSMLTLAAEKKLAGEIIVSGNSGSAEAPAVLLNGERIRSGQSFFSAGVLSTSESGSATVNLGKLGRIDVSPNSVLSLNFTENNISGNLSAGQIKVFANEGVSVNIRTVDGAVNNDADQTGVYTIDVRSGLTKTSTERGSISLNNGLPAQQTDDDDDDDRLKTVLIVGGIIGATVAIVLIATSGDDDDDVTSPVR
jgi:hypothetical protein